MPVFCFYKGGLGKFCSCEGEESCQPNFLPKNEDKMQKIKLFIVLPTFIEKVFCSTIKPRFNGL